MSVANLQTYALSKGIKKSYQEMTQAEQATLRYNYLMSTTADAQGDFSRTSDSLANQLRVLKLNITELAGDIGKELIPVAQEGLKYINSLVDRLKKAFNAGGVESLAKEVGNVLADVVNKIAEYMPKFVDVGTEILLSLADGILKNTDELIDSFIDIGKSVIQCIYEIAPKMVEIGEQLLVRLAQGAESGMYNITTKALEMVTNFVDTIDRNLPTIMDAGLNMLKGLAKGIKDNLPLLIERATELLTNFVIYICENLDIIIGCALDIIIALGKGLIKFVAKIAEKAPDILEALKDGLINSVYVLKDAVVSIVDYIKDGLVNADWEEVAVNIANTLASFMSPMAIQIRDDIINTFTPQVTTSRTSSAGHTKGGNSKGFELSDDVLATASANALGGVAGQAFNMIKEVANTAAECTEEIDYSLNDLSEGLTGITETAKVAETQNDLLYTKSKELLEMEKKLQEQQKQEYSKMLAEKATIGIKAIHEGYKKQYDAEAKLIKEKEDKISRLELKQQAKSTLLQNAQAMAEVDDSYKTLTEAELKAIAEKSENTKDMNIAEMLDGEKEITIEQLKAITDRYDQIAEIEKENLNAEKDIQQQMLDSYTTVYDGLVSGYENAYNEITNKQNSLADKLKSFGGLFDVVEKTINEQGDTEDFMQLGDLGEDVKQLQLLSQGIEELRKRGVNQDFLDNYLSTESVEDSLDFTELLLAQNKETLQSYVKTWEEKNRLAEELSANFYQTEYDTLKEQFTDKVKDELNIMPEEAEQVGQDTAQKLADGLKSGYDAVKNAVSDLVGLMKSTVEGELFTTGASLGVTSNINQTVQSKDTGVLNTLGAILGAITDDTNTTPIIIEMDGTKVGEGTVDGTLRELKRRGVSIDGIN